MPIFVYKAKKKTSETVTGQISAQSEDDAIELINQLGLLPVSVVVRPLDDIPKTGRTRRIKSKDLYIFNRQLANLLKAGVPLLRALTIIGEQVQNYHFREVISSVALSIKNGKTFSESLFLYPEIFSSLYITMIHSGEESGNLQEMLTSVSLYQKKEEEIFSKVRAAFAYPVFMAVVGVITVYCILTFVFPKMAGLFESLGETLPLPTIILLNISNVLSKGFLWILLGVVSVVFFVQQAVKSKKGKIASSRLLLCMPLFGEIILKVELARFCRTLILLLKSGVSITRSLYISIPMLSNELIKKDFDKCRESLIAGGAFGESMRQSKEIPVMMGHLISVGEESGNLNDVLAEIAEGYEQEADEKIKIATTLLEPLMILVVGLVIGFIVVAMLLPIFQIDVLS